MTVDPVHSQLGQISEKAYSSISERITTRLISLWNQCAIVPNQLPYKRPDHSHKILQQDTGSPRAPETGLCICRDGPALLDGRAPDWNLHATLSYRLPAIPPQSGIAYFSHSTAAGSWQSI